MDDPRPHSPDGSSRALIFDVTLLLIFLGAVWGRYLAGASVLYSGDTFYYFYPLRFTLFSALHQGYFPDWESATLSGNPFCANPQANCYYPLSAWFALPDFFTAYQWAVVSHLALAGIGTMMWLRGRGHSRLAGLIAALVIMSGGVSLSLVNRLDKLESLSWWPWAMWGLERMSRRRRGGLAIVAGALAMAVLAGGLEVWGMMVGALAVWAVLADVGERKAGAPSSPSLGLPVDSDPEVSVRDVGDRAAGAVTSPGVGIPVGTAQGARGGNIGDRPAGADISPAAHQSAARGISAILERFRPLAALAIALGLCLLITAPQWLELRELLAGSTRSSGVNFGRATELSLHPGELWGTILPHLFYNAADEVFHPLPGGPGEPRYLLGLYLGWLPALAALSSLRWLFRREAEGRAVRASILIIMLGLFMALGVRNPLYRALFDTFPPLRTIRYPEKFLVLSAFFTLPLMAVGIDGWRLTRRGFLIPLGAGLVAVALFFIVPGLEHRLAAALFTLTTGASPAVWMKQLEWLDPELRRQALLLTLAGGVALLGARGLVRPGLSTVIVAGLVGIDLWLGTWALNPPMDARALREPPELAGALTARSQRARVHVLSLYDPQPFATPAGLSSLQTYGWLWQLLYPNTGTLAGVRYADGSRAIRPDHPARFFAALRGLSTARQLELAALSGVDAVVATPREAEVLDLLPGVERLARSQKSGLELWGLTSTVPPAYFISSARYFSSSEAVLEALFLGRYSPRQQVGLVGSGTAMPVSSVGESMVQPAVQVQELEGGKRRVLETVSAGLGGWLVLPESWDPGWTAKVDGVPARVLEANGYQQAVRLPVGVHRVELEFVPRGRRSALGLSGVGLGLTLLSLRRRKS